MEPHCLREAFFRIVVKGRIQVICVMSNANLETCCGHIIRRSIPKPWASCKAVRLFGEVVREAPYPYIWGQAAQKFLRYRF